MNSASVFKTPEPSAITRQRFVRNWSTHRSLIVGVSLVIGVALLFVGLPVAQLSKSTSGMGDWPFYGSPQAAVNAADVVVTAKYIDSRNATMFALASDSTDPLLNPQAGVATVLDSKDDGVEVVISRVAVVSSIKGDLEVGRVIEVSQPGTRFLGVNYPAAGNTFISDVAKMGAKETADTSVLLLLSQHPDSTYSPINPDEGVLLVVGTQVLSTDPDLVGPSTLSAYQGPQ